ncbi:MAG: hypothetical protein IJM35_04795 [Bacteroidales bacterium]|jgi:hypothetical protein|nr:hypothetical protein [Bacteroidales bacterium]
MVKENKSKPWVKDLLVAFAGTTLSIILTFGTSALIDNVNRKKDRKLTALMALSSIESSIRALEESGSILARKDTLAQRLLSIPLSDIKKYPPEALMSSISEIMVNYSISMDKTIESIFSSNTDTWRNVGNFQFIDNVGKTYASLRDIENDWTIQMRTVSDEYARIMEHPEGYPGESLPEKILSNQTVRKQLQGITSSREWLKYVSTALRSSNKRNMAMIGISEEEVKAFTDERALQEGEAESNAINEAYLRGEFSIPEIVLDTLGTFSSWQD